MSFPGALSGVKKIFLAFMITLISTFVMNICVIINEAGYVTESETMVAVGLVGASASYFIGGLFIIGATILEIVGIFNARGDETGSKFLLIALIAALVNAAASIIYVFYDFAKMPMAIATNVLAIVTVVFTVLGIKGFVEKLGDEALARRATVTWILMAVLRAAATTVTILTPATGEDTTPETFKFVFIMYISYTVLITAYYVIYVLFLSNAKNLLRPKEGSPKFTSSVPKYYNPAED